MSKSYSLIIGVSSPEGANVDLVLLSIPTTKPDLVSGLGYVGQLLTTIERLPHTVNAEWYIKIKPEVSDNGNTGQNV